MHACGNCGGARARNKAPAWSHVAGQTPYAYGLAPDNQPMTANTRRMRKLLGLAVPLLVLCLLAGPVAAQEPPAQQEYVVQAGDTLFSIAQYFGTTVEAIAAANGIDDPSLITVGQKLVIPGEQAQPTPQPRVYVVKPGDTLSAIAQRFGTSVKAIVSANDIADPSWIDVGQKLVIPASVPEKPIAPTPPPYSRLHLVRPGETLPFLAYKYGTTVWALRQANELQWPGVSPGQELVIPWPTAATVATPRFPEITATPMPVLQGQTVVIEVRGRGDMEVAGQFLGAALSFIPDNGWYWALCGVDALTAPGSYALTLTIAESDTGDRLTMRQAVTVSAGSFGRTNIAVPADRQRLLDPTLSETERKKVNRVFAGLSGAKQWQGAFGLPLTGEPVVTAGFGQRRSYDGGPVSSYHSGQDLDAETGTPVFAPAAGTIVMAEPLQVRGNVVIVDHGFGVFTGFWHLSQIDVKAGQQVSRGDVVGLVGNTGLSTGSHLHWEMRIRGVPVDPLQWTRQAFP